MSPTIDSIPYRASPDGWTLSYDVYSGAGVVDDVQVTAGMLPRGGLVLRQMRHAGFSFAEHSCVVGIWVIPRDSTRFQPKQLILGPPHFEQNPRYAGGGEDYTPVVHSALTTDAPGNFQVYNTIRELKAQFVTREPLFADSRGTSGKLTVVQRALFTDYSCSPSHEPAGSLPGGALTATRYFPLLSFDYLDDGYVQAIRMDVRIHLRLEGLNHALDSDNRADMLGYVLNSLVFPNQAGIFRDEDAFTGQAKQVAHGEFGPQAGFSAVEKPLLYEVCSIGLYRGSKYLRPQPRLEYVIGGDPNDDFPIGSEGWDNVHWWGSRGAGREIISAIGGFHAAHFHWRWPLHVQKAPAIYGKRFQGINLDRGGPHLDPSLPDQTVRFAIEKYARSHDPDHARWPQLSRRYFSQLFHHQNSPPPQDVNTADFYGNEGDNLVLWVSTEAVVPESGSRLGFGGTFLPHGFFFAHEPEPSLPARAKTGSRTPEYWGTTPTRKWSRL
jgi:hypothetical protein